MFRLNSRPYSGGGHKRQKKDFPPQPGRQAPHQRLRALQTSPHLRALCRTSFSPRENLDDAARLLFEAKLDFDSVIFAIGTNVKAYFMFSAPMQVPENHAFSQSQTGGKFLGQPSSGHFGARYFSLVSFCASFFSDNFFKHSFRDRISGALGARLLSVLISRLSTDRPTHPPTHPPTTPPTAVSPENRRVPTSRMCTSPPTPLDDSTVGIDSLPLRCRHVRVYFVCIVRCRQIDTNLPMFETQGKQ